MSIAEKVAEGTGYTLTLTRRADGKSASALLLNAQALAIPEIAVEYLGTLLEEVA